MPTSKASRVCICLIRGINVGGANTVRMAELRTLLAKLGYEGAQTHIQSGNAVFRTAESAADCERRLAQAFAKTFGFRASIMVRTLAAWRKAVRASPFDAGKHDPKRLLLHCLARPPSAAALKALEAIAAPEEKWRAKGAWLYAYFANGIARSKLATGIERALGVAATARNWNTALKLLEMAEALERG